MQVTVFVLPKCPVVLSYGSANADRGEPETVANTAGSFVLQPPQFLSHSHYSAVPRAIAYLLMDYF